MNRSSLPLFISGCCLLVVAFLIPYAMYSYNPRLIASRLFYPELNPKQLTLIADHVAKSYMDEVEREDLMRNALKGMLEQLDPFSTYIEPEQQADYEALTQGKFAGIGVYLGAREGRVVVDRVMENGPAMKAGVLAGDIFDEVDRTDVSNISNVHTLSRLVKGEIGTLVTIKFFRPGIDDYVTLKITRDTVEIPSVVVEEMDGDILYIRLNEFHGKSASQLKAALEKHSKMTGLILDLRNNGGGVLGGAKEITGYFLEKDKEIVKVISRDDEKIYQTDVDGAWKDLPMSILINSHSASASEILAGALKDHERAIVWGERSYGKGLVQELIPLKNNTASLKLTVARYLTPSGYFLQKDKDHEGGIAPTEGYEFETEYYSNAYYETMIEQAWQELNIKTDFKTFLKNNPPQRKEPTFPDPLVVAAHKELLQRQK